MKSLLVTLAFVLGGANVYAQTAVTTVTLANRVQTAVQSARVVNSAVAARVALLASAGVKNLSSSALQKASNIVSDIELIAKSDELVNGLSKAVRMDAAQMAFLAVVKNDGKDPAIDRIVTGQLLQRLTSKSSSEFDGSTYQKSIDIMNYYTDPDKNLNFDQSVQIVIPGGSTESYDRACGGSGAPAKR